MASDVNELFRMIEVSQNDGLSAIDLVPLKLKLEYLRALERDNDLTAVAFEM